MEDPTSIDEAACAACHRVLPRNAPGGMCPACLLGEGARILSASQAKPGGFLPPTADELSLLFADFIVVECLGQGGMGAVYKAVQTDLDRTVAIKILPPETAADGEFTERFRREAATLAKLDHPNIVRLFEYGQREGYAYFVMEFVDGQDLAKRDPSGPLSPSEVWHLAEPLCEALEHSHQRGVIHRDIKPANILLDRHGQLKVADFGLARLLKTEEADYALTRTHAVMGTPRYMAPEQMTNQAEVDHRADIYGLGVVFYEWLTGSTPVGHFDPPSEVRPSLDPRVDDVILKALSSDPDQRFSTVSELREALRAVCQSRGRTRRERSRILAWQVFGVSLAAAVVGGLIAAYWVWRGSGLNQAERKPSIGQPMLRRAPAGTLIFVGAVDEQAKQWRGASATAVAMAFAREEFGLAVTTEGRVLGWGQDRFNQASAPATLAGVVAVAVGQGERAAHALALRHDGNVVGWGDNTYHQAQPPSTLSNVVGLAAGEFHSMAVLGDGRIVTWGKPGSAALRVPGGLAPAQAVAAGANFNLALLRDGTVVAWGDNGARQCEPPSWSSPAVSIAAGIAHGLACLENGRVVAWGDNGAGQCQVPIDLPPAVQVMAGGESSAALDREGQLHVWGRVPETGLALPDGKVLGVAFGLSSWAILTAP